MKRRIGMILNPLAGIGGSVGLKGSDGCEIQAEAFKRGAVRKSRTRMEEALTALQSEKEKAVIYAAPGEMGSDLACSLGFEVVTVGNTGMVTTGEDTKRIAKEMEKISVDILVFAGGDGTARDICQAVSARLPVIGVPAGVKIHSAVYAMSPREAGRALRACLSGQFDIRMAEVMDIDEEVYRKGKLQAKLYGYLAVPAIADAIQNPKAASHNSTTDVEGICEEITGRMEKDVYYILGAGSTLYSVKQALGCRGTLIGIDIYRNKRLVEEDVSEKTLLKYTKENDCRLIVTVIGGQGHIFGRGNQQISPKVIRQIGIQNIWVAATASKIYALPGQSLFVDTGDEKINESLRGYRKVIVGWQETLICRVL